MRLRALASTVDEKLTKFGFQTVSEAVKARRVQDVFSSVAKKYDVMNDVMSFGIHRLWKDYFVQQLDPPPKTKVLDVAGGTGDIAFRIMNYKGRCQGGKDTYEITVLDKNASMLKEGRKKPGGDKISWIEGDALDLPFPSNSFDVYTIVFGIRNVVNIQQCLKEAVRVLVPGGRFLCMEFSALTNPLLKRLYDTYSFQLIPVFGELIARDRSSYQYLVESIRNFPKQDEFAQMISDSGFCCVDYKNLSAGIVAIHSGFKTFELKKNETKAIPKI